MIGFAPLVENGLEMVGFLPEFLDLRDTRPAKEQFDANYRHGGGWSPQEAWTFDANDLTIKYPGDPRLKPIAITALRDEMIYVYPSGIVNIVQLDGSFEIARMD